MLHATVPVLSAPARAPPRRPACSRVAAAAGAASLEASLSPLVADVSGDGSIRAQRLDLRLKLPGVAAPLHLVTWGTAHVSPGGPLDMALCLPADTLEAVLGVRGLPEGYGVVIPVRGTVAAPAPELGGAASRLAALVVRGRAAALAGGGGAGMPRWMAEELAQVGDAAGDLAFRMPAPPAAEGL